MMLGLSLGLGMQGGAAEPAKTYADFVTQVTTIATAGAVSFSAAGTVFAAGVYRSTAVSATKTLFGSPWQNVSGGGSNLAGLFTHGLESLAVYDALISAGTVVCITSASPSSGTLSAINRNGLLSTSGSGSTFTTPQILIWHPVLLKPVSYNPNAGTGPTDYTWP